MLAIASPEDAEHLIQEAEVRLGSWFRDSHDSHRHRFCFNSTMTIMSWLSACVFVSLPRLGVILGRC